MSDPACRNYRELLGVYVVGAIEPNERSLLDAHLNQCYGCREELAGLAVLPAMLHRIQVAEAEQIAQAGLSRDQDDPAPQVLSGLLAEVRARRRTRRLRTVLAGAAAVIVAVSGSVAVTSAVDQLPHQVASPLEVVTARHDGISGEVKYGNSSQWGTEILTRVRGIPQGTYCQLWITTAKGHTKLVGGWLVLGPGGNYQWYQSTTHIPASSITAFKLTAAGKVLLRFPVT